MAVFHVRNQNAACQAHVHWKHYVSTYHSFIRQIHCLARNPNRVSLLQIGVHGELGPFIVWDSSLSSCSSIPSHLSLITYSFISRKYPAISSPLSSFMCQHALHFLSQSYNFTLLENKNIFVRSWSIFGMNQLYKLNKHM